MDALALLAAWEHSLTQPLPLRAATAFALGVGDEEPGRVDIDCRERAAIRLHTLIAGDMLEATSTCSRCDERMDIAIPAATFEIESPAAREVQCDGWQITLRVPDSQDILFALKQDDSEAALFARCIVQAQQHSLAVQPDDLPATVRERCEEQLDRLAPLANLTLLLRCPACGEADEVPFDASAFVLDRLGFWVEDRLDEVVRLCRAFAWREEDVLAMSPWRRRFYLARAENA
jgi:hypothetical protein